MRFGIEVMPKELGFAEVPLRERMLIRHVVLCWVRLQLCEYQYTSSAKQVRTLAQGNYWEKRLSAVEGRYLRALTTLARIRKMGLPAMRVNIAAQGGQQVNIANRRGPGPLGPKTGPRRPFPREQVTKSWTWVRSFARRGPQARLRPNGEKPRRAS